MIRVQKLRLRLLGGFRIDTGAAPVDIPANGRRLVAFLGVRTRVSRSLVAGTLWPDVPEERAHGNLRSSIWRLNRAGMSIIDTQADTLSLVPEMSVDVQSFTDAAARIQRPAQDADGDRAELLDAGDLLPGWYDDWVLSERDRLRQIRLHALEALAFRLTARNQFGPALDAAFASVRIEPLRESAHRAVVAVHLAENNVVEAVRHYEVFRALLREELGIEPSRQFADMLPVVPGLRRRAAVAEPSVGFSR